MTCPVCTRSDWIRVRDQIGSASVQFVRCIECRHVPLSQRDLGVVHGWTWAMRP